MECEAIYSKCGCPENSVKEWLCGRTGGSGGQWDDTKHSVCACVCDARDQNCIYFHNKKKESFISSIKLFAFTVNTSTLLTISHALSVCVRCNDGEINTAFVGRR